MFSEGDPVSLGQQDVGGGPAELGNGAFQPGQPRLHQARAGDVVRVAVSVHFGKETKARLIDTEGLWRKACRLPTCRFQMESEFLDQLQVPVDGLQHRVDEDGVLGDGVGEQVCVGAALRVKQLGTQTS